MIRIGIVLYLVLLASLAHAQPNVIIVMTDDQGYGELSCHGNPVLKTPNLDGLRKKEEQELSLPF
jgi:hypothetical protein